MGAVETALYTFLSRPRGRVRLMPTLSMMSVSLGRCALLRQTCELWGMCCGGVASV